MTGVLVQAFNSFKNYLSGLQPNNEWGQVRGNRGIEQQPPRPPRLFSLGGSRKRPLERVIVHEIELELTDDEDEGIVGTQNYRDEQGASKRRRVQTDMPNTRGSGIPPDIPGLQHQPWQFNFNFSKYKKKKNQERTDASQASTSAFMSRAIAEEKTEINNCRKEIEVITIKDDDEPFVSKSAYFKKQKLRNPPDNRIITKKRNLFSYLSKPTTKMDPFGSIFRLEEKNIYRNLVQKMGSAYSSCKRPQPLFKSRLKTSETVAFYNNWTDANASVSFGSLQRSATSDRVKNDLRLFSTPAASRSSGSSPEPVEQPIGPTSPPVIDLEDEKRQESVSRLSHSFADLDDALSSTKYFGNNSIDENNKETEHKQLVAVTEDEHDDDVAIIAEKIIHKPYRLNSLALEQSTSPYVRRGWLDELASSWRDNQKRREQEIFEHLTTVEVLNKESTLEKDLREDIRRKLKLTEIIVLEEPPPVLPEITEEMWEVINGALRGRGGDTEVLAQVCNIDFTRGDAKTLEPAKWLNDNVINAYLELIATRSKMEEGLPKVHIFTTFFYPKLIKEGYSNALKRWTRKVDIFDHELLIFPIHLGLHWCLAAANLQEKTVKYFDSLGGKNDRCLNALFNYLAQESKERKGVQLVKSEWSLENVEDVPQQQNGSDCGVFTCKGAEYLSRHSNLTYLQENMDYYRWRMIYEIVKQNLMYP